jgi:hypothetical protein
MNIFIETSSAQKLGHWIYNQGVGGSILVYGVISPMVICLLIADSIGISSRHLQRYS